MSMLSKILLTAVFIPIYLLGSVIAKSKTWLGIVLPFMIGMLMFAMIPIISPLDATVMNVVLCAAGGAMFSIGLGALSCMVLSKKDIL